ncbi:MAG: 4-hydroxythreonine-4-phosphate dehydrogenase PdxA [Balneolaceae bacterium]
MRPIIAISMGDYNGIGPEVVLKTLKKAEENRVIPLILGNEKVFRFYLEILGMEMNLQPLDQFNQAEILKGINSDAIPLLNCTGNTLLELKPGTLSREAGKASMQAVETGVDLCLKNQTHALVTAPISKEAIQRAGYKYPGHTEFLAERTSESNFMMMMVSQQLRIGLATIHIPLSEVPLNIHKHSILRFLQLFQKSLREDFNIAEPRVAVLGLNPHAGDGGVIGREEREILSPAIQEAAGTSGKIDGPFAADGFFGNKLYEGYDGVLAMYHDQGLIPFKTLTFGAGVNFSAGLPIIRTSPDHGTAFGIAGKNQASHKSFESSYQLAIRLAYNKLTQ